MKWNHDEQYRPGRIGRTRLMLADFWNFNLGWGAEPENRALVRRKVLARIGLVSALVLVPALLLSALTAPGTAFLAGYEPVDEATAWRGAPAPHKPADVVVVVNEVFFSNNELLQMQADYESFMAAYIMAMETGVTDGLKRYATPDFGALMETSALDMHRREVVRVYDEQLLSAARLGFDTPEPPAAPRTITAEMGGLFDRVERDNQGNYLEGTEFYFSLVRISFIKEGERWLIENIAFIADEPAESPPPYYID